MACGAGAEEFRNPGGKIVSKGYIQSTDGKFRFSGGWNDEPAKVTCAPLEHAYESEHECAQAIQLARRAYQHGKDDKARDMRNTLNL